MIRTLLACMLIPGLAAAQGKPPVKEPPPPARPATPASPVRPAEPLPPLLPMDPAWRMNVERLADEARWMALDMTHNLDIAGIADEARWHAFDAMNNLDIAHVADEARLSAMDAMHNIDVAGIADEARWNALDAMHNIDVAGIADQARWSALDAMNSVDIAHVADEARWNAQEAMHNMDLAGMANDVRVNVQTSFDADFGSSFSTRPPSSWAKEDPADSLWRVAREALNRGDYRRASRLFSELTTKFQSSRYTADAMYWRAVALYRIGGTTELREALTVLQTQKERYPQTKSDPDPALGTRILGALAARGDANAQRQLEQNAASGMTTCDREADAVRAEALNALARSDPEGSAQILRDVLARRDECSTRLRSRAVFLLGQRNDASNNAVLIDVMRNDPDPEVRSDAMSWVARMPGEANVAALEAVMNSSDDERMQRAAIRALATSSSPRARQAVRGVIEREGAPLTLRREAVQFFGQRDRASAEDAAYLRSVYGRTTEARLKSSIVATLSRIGGEENQQWLMALAQNEAEPTAARAYALEYLMRNETPIAQVVRTYDAISQRDMRERVISILGRRDEPEATDKLIEIAKAGTDPNLRRHAISALTRKKDPRTTKLLLEIINP
jgi:HEAT repeat protein